MWKTIPSFEFYEVSEDGQVRNRRTDRILKPELAKGYKRVTLSEEGVVTRFLVHRLVCAVFNGARPDDKPVCRHKDGNNMNNHKDNLVWGTHKENEEDKRAHGTAPIGEKNPHASSTEAQISAVLAEYRAEVARRKAEGHSNVKHGYRDFLCKKHNISLACLKSVTTGNTWGHLDVISIDKPTEPSSVDGRVLAEGQARPTDI